MAKLGFISLMLSLILVVQATAGKSEPNPFEGKVQNGLELSGSFRGAAYEPVASSPTEGSTILSPSDESREAEAPLMIRRLGKHHSSDKSVAGGELIIVGLVTAIFAAVFCYVRVTRRRDGGHVGK